MLKAVDKAIWELELKRCYREDMLMCISELTSRYFIEYLNQQYPLSFSLPGFKTNYYNGVEVDTKWPYNNEIVIYDKKKVSYHPELLVKIQLDFNVPTSQS
jgi:hypothetical protein